MQEIKLLPMTFTTLQKHTRKSSHGQKLFQSFVNCNPLVLNNFGNSFYKLFKFDISALCFDGFLTTKQPT